MQIHFQRNRKIQGSLLMVALVVAGILGIGLASYLTLVRQQHVSVVRSQAWNAALALAEGGIEEAMAQLNPSAMLFNTNIDRGANGWTFSDGLYHAPRRTMLNGAGYCDVAISQDTLPLVYSTGYVSVPTFSAPVQRTVRVRTGNSGLFRGAMAVRIDVDFKGNKVSTDSFDSMDPTASTDGRYDITKRRAHGDVATTEGFLNVQNANVMGTLFTGPNGNYNVGSQGSVGDVNWVLTTLGLQPGHYKNDFNMDFPDVLPPYNSGLQPVGGMVPPVSGTNYTWVLGNGDYYVNGDAEFKTGDTILVVGNARVFVTGNFSMSGSSSIIVVQSGMAGLDLYVGGASTSITTVHNSVNCATFRYYGLPSNTSLTLSGNDSFLGTIYAPSAMFTLGGGGSDVYDFEGACVVYQIKMNGHFNFHFDENLKRKGPFRGYVITGWSEI